MKNKSLLVAIIISLIGLSTQAQTQMKIGFANIDYILRQLPETLESQKILAATNEEYQNQLKLKYQEYQEKLQVYEAEVNDMLEIVKEEKGNELNQLLSSAQAFEGEIQKALQAISAELMQPIYVKVDSTIDVVAKENAYALILNGQISGLNVVIYSNENREVSDLVLEKLGIPAKEN